MCVVQMKYEKKKRKINISGKYTVPCKKVSLCYDLHMRKGLKHRINSLLLAWYHYICWSV